MKVYIEGVSVNLNGEASVRVREEGKTESCNLRFPVPDGLTEAQAKEIIRVQIAEIQDVGSKAAILFAWARKIALIDIPDKGPEEEGKP